MQRGTRLLGRSVEDAVAFAPVWLTERLVGRVEAERMMNLKSPGLLDKKARQLCFTAVLVFSFKQSQT